jgi:hypothetical protein
VTVYNDPLPPDDIERLREVINWNYISDVLVSLANVLKLPLDRPDLELTEATKASHAALCLIMASKIEKLAKELDNIRRAAME